MNQEDEDPEYEEMDFNDFITHGEDGFVAYRVTGESKVSYILPNFFVVVDTRLQPQIGDVVVARVNGRNNVKILENKQLGLYLVSKDKRPNSEQITKREDGSTILGVVKGLVARV